VTYQHATEEKRYVAFRQRQGSPVEQALAQTSWLKLPFGYADVTVSGIQTDFFNPAEVYGYWAWEGLADALPRDYVAPGLSRERPRETSPRNPNYIASVKTAESLEKRGKDKDAELEYRKALLFDDAPVEALIGLGRIAYAHKRWEDLHQWLRRALKIDPDNQEARELLFSKSEIYPLVVQADSLRENGQLDGAKKLYQRALHRDEHYTLALKGLAKIAYQKKAWTAFQKWLNQALVEDPEDSEARALLNDNPELRSLLAHAGSLMAAKDVKDAEKACKKALKLNARSGQALKMLGLMASEKGDWETAKAWWEQWVQSEPDNPDANYHFGIACREVGKNRVLIERKRLFKLSQRHFDAVIANEPAYSDVLYQRALLERWRRNWENAIRWGHKQIAVKPALSHAVIGLHRIYRSFLHNANKDRVLSFLKTHPSEVADYFVAEQLRLQEKYSQAEPIFKRLLPRSSELSKTPLLLSLLKLYVATGNQQGATACFDQAFGDLSTRTDAAFLFEATKYIFDDRELAIYQKMDRLRDVKSFFRQFWKHRDPAPASPNNYRAMEHFRRMDYAEKNFWYDGIRPPARSSDVTVGLYFPESYKANAEFNDKGLIYIRYGEPDVTA
ncbi:GWxTD domain-containing protein, partial [Candidatus Parcubacteria bacterium]